MNCDYSVGYCDGQNWRAGCNFSGFGKVVLIHVIRQYSEGNFQVRRKVVEVHCLVLHGVCLRQIVGRMLSRNDGYCLRGQLF